MSVRVLIHLTSTLPKNQAAPIEKVISDLFIIPKMFGAFVTLWRKRPKANGKLCLSCRCQDNSQTKFLPLEARASFFLKHEKQYLLKIINRIQLHNANELGHLIKLSHVWAFNCMHEKVGTNTHNVLLWQPIGAVSSIFYDSWKQRISG